MLRQLFKDSFVYGIGGLLTKSISLLLLPVYVKFLAPEDYGVIDFLVVFFTLLGVLFSLEIYQAIARYYHEFGDNSEKVKSVSTAFLFTASSYLLFTLLVVVLSKTLASLLFSSYSKDGLALVISLAAISTYFSVLYAFCVNILRYQFRAGEYVLCSIINALLSIGFSILFVIFLNYGIKGVFLGQLIGNLIAFILSFYISKDNYSLHFEVKKLHTLLIFSLPLVPSSIGVFLLAYLDRIVIKSFLTISDLGIYGVANRLASIAPLIMMALTTAFTPLIYKNYKNSTTPDEISKIFSFLVAFIIIMVSGVALFSDEILYLFTSPEYYGAAVLLPFLLLAGFLSKMYDFTPGLAIAKKTKIIATIYVIGALLTLSINILIIKKMGIFGVAVTNLFSALIVFCINYYFSQKYYKINYRIKSIMLTCLSAVFLILIARHLFISSFFFKCLTLVTITLLPIIMRLIDINYIKRLCRIYCL